MKAAAPEDIRWDKKDAAKQPQLFAWVQMVQQFKQSNGSKEKQEVEKNNVNKIPLAGKHIYNSHQFNDGIIF